ncbi:hypothetical protein SDC9_136968 [bioreactor metagenome]|uniref:Uncharacterized protein n=1 Tax=bioreactor metagenome TaxID=1076179 RepID=A0A645DM44_9ZZZZ
MCRELGPDAVMVTVQDEAFFINVIFFNPAAWNLKVYHGILKRSRFSECLVSDNDVHVLVDFTFQTVKNRFWQAFKDFNFSGHGPFTGP